MIMIRDNLICSSNQHLTQTRHLCSCQKFLEVKNILYMGYAKHSSLKNHIFISSVSEKCMLNIVTFQLSASANSISEWSF